MTTSPQLSFSDPELYQGVADAMAAAALTPAALEGGDYLSQHQTLAQDLGWLAAIIPEADGGLELGLDFAADLLREAGRHLIAGPLRETAILLPALAAECPELRAHLQGVVAGEVRLTLAEVLPNGDWLVPWLRQSTHAVTLTPAGEGSALRLITIEGVAAEDMQPLDPASTLARIRAADLPQANASTLDAAASARVWTRFDLATAAELLGIADAALQQTLAYVAERRQFGAVIGSFQALKHRLADVHVANTSAKLAIGGALRAGLGDGARAAAVRIARVLAADAAFGAASAAIQLHGGLGFSWETSLHLYLKRAHRLSAMRGGTEAQREAAGAQMIEKALRHTA